MLGSSSITMCRTVLRSRTNWAATKLSGRRKSRKRKPILTKYSLMARSLKSRTLGPHSTRVTRQFTNCQQRSHRKWAKTRGSQRLTRFSRVRKRRSPQMHIKLMKLTNRKFLEYHLAKLSSPCTAASTKLNGLVSRRPARTFIILTQKFCRNLAKFQLLI